MKFIVAVGASLPVFGQSLTIGQAPVDAVADAEGAVQHAPRQGYIDYWQGSLELNESAYWANTTCPGNDPPLPEEEAAAWMQDLDARVKLNKTRAPTNPATLNAKLGENRTEHLSNMCMHNRIIPEFYLLGVEQAATTSFAGFFMQSPSVAATPKAIRMMSSQEHWKQGGEFDGWVRNFPRCSHDARMMSVDSTNMLDRPFAVDRINAIYGSFVYRLQFAVIFREPVERMFSAYMHGRRHGWSNGLYRETNFTTIAEDVIAGKHDKYEIVERTKYVQYVTKWFRHFNATQFFVMMMKDVVSQENMVQSGSRLMNYLWTKMDLQHGDNEWKGAKSPRRNSYPHPSLESSVDVVTVMKLRGIVHQWASPMELATVLHNASMSGADLWGCRGCGRLAVEDWILRGW